MQRLVCGTRGHRDLQVGAEGGQVVAAPLGGGEGLPGAVLQPRLQPQPLGGARRSRLPKVPRPVVSPTDGFVGKPAGVRREFVHKRKGPLSPVLLENLQASICLYVKGKGRVCFVGKPAGESLFVCEQKGLCHSFG